jgi:hypothetical protein
MDELEELCRSCDYWKRRAEALEAEICRVAGYLAVHGWEDYRFGEPGEPNEFGVRSMPLHIRVLDELDAEEAPA